MNKKPMTTDTPSHHSRASSDKVRAELTAKLRADRLKWRILWGIFIALLLFVFFYWQGKNEDKLTPLATHLMGISVQHVGHSQKGEPYRLSGEAIEGSSKNSNYYLIHAPALEFLSNAEQWVHLQAQKAHYFEANKKLDLEGEVTFYESGGGFFKTHKASIDIVKMEAKGKAPVSGVGNLIAIEAQKGFKFGEGRLFFYGRPVLEILDKNPICVIADQFLEYNMRERYYRAFGNAKLFAERLALRAQDLYAYAERENTQKEKEQEKIGGKLSYLRGNGSVKIVLENLTAFGEHFIYKIKEKRLDLWDKVHLISNGDHLFSKHMVAFFEEKEGKDSIKQVEFTDGVKIILKKGDIIRAKRAFYEPAQEKLWLYENVFLERGQNILCGEKAVLDLKTGLSQLIQKKNEQVQGIFRIQKKRNKKIL